MDPEVIRERDELLAWLDAGGGDPSLLLESDTAVHARFEQRLVDFEVRRTLGELVRCRERALRRV